MGELPEQIRQRFRQLNLPPADVLVLADDLQVAQFFDRSLAAGAPPKAAANWVMGDITAFCKVPESNVTVRDLYARLLGHTETRLWGKLKRLSLCSVFILLFSS